MRKKKLIIIFSVICALTLLIVLNSAVFSVQHIDAYCYNADDLALEQKVAANTGIKKGRSIFTLKEDRAIAAVESAVGEVRVINIERKFPNRVCVNYVKIAPYFEWNVGGKYYVCGNDARILAVNDTVTDPDRIIVLRSNGAAVGSKAGELLFAEGSRETTLLTDVFVSLSRLGYYGELVELIEKIDIRSERNVYMRMAAGVAIKIEGTDGMFEKLRKAMSFYNRSDIAHLNGGTIVVTNGTDSYSPRDLYAEEMGN